MSERHTTQPSRSCVKHAEFKNYHSPLKTTVTINRHEYLLVMRNVKRAVRQAGDLRFAADSVASVLPLSQFSHISMAAMMHNPFGLPTVAHDHLVTRL